MVLWNPKDNSLHHSSSPNPDSMASHDRTAISSTQPGTPSNKSFRGSTAPEAGVRGIPSPFINLDERGRDTPHTSLLPLLPMRKDFLDEVLGDIRLRRGQSFQSSAR